MTKTAQLLVDCKNTIGESCFEDPRDNCLWWTDIEQKRVFRLSGESDLATFELPDRAGFFLPRANPGFVIGFPKRVVIANQELTEFSTVCEIENDQPHNRCNDGDVDPAGGIVFGSMNEHPDPGKRQPSGILYRLSPTGDLTTLDSGIRTSNGTAFSTDGKTMYFADTGNGLIRRFSVSDDMETINEIMPLGGPDIAPGLPDGSTVDSQGNYWNARVWGGCIACISPDGKTVSTIEVPTPGPTCITLGGKDRTRLYITSLNKRRSPDDPAPPAIAGGLFVANVEVPGTVQRLCGL